MTRALGVDLGARRIGIAVSDRSGTIATPLTVLTRAGSASADHRALARLVDEEDAELIVVGLPVNMDGTEGPAATAARIEAAALASVVAVPVVLSDERRSTVTAARAMRANGRRAAARRQTIDQAAAAVILQHWLDGPRTQPAVVPRSDR